MVNHVLQESLLTNEKFNVMQQDTKSPIELLHNLQMFAYPSYLEIPDKIGLGMVYVEAENGNRITNS